MKIISWYPIYERSEGYFIFHVPTLAEDIWKLTSWLHHYQIRQFGELTSDAIEEYLKAVITRVGYHSDD